MKSHGRGLTLDGSPASQSRRLSILAIGALLAACSTIRHKALLSVGKAGFSVFGKTVQSQVELTDLLLAYGVQFVEVRLEAGVEHEQVRQAMAAIKRAGATVGLVGNVRDKESPAN